MNSILIQSMIDSDKARQEYHESVLKALKFASKCNADDIEWNNKNIESKKIKPERNLTAELVIKIGFIFSMVVCLVGGSILIWNWGA